MRRTGSAPPSAHFAASLSPTLLVGSHAWRFVGIGFLVGWLTGVLPAGFAIPVGLGDIAAAAWAVALVPGLRRGSASPKSFPAWNTFGFVDLVMAILLGIAYSNTPLGVLSPGTVTTRVMAMFPFSLIPTFVVPLFILLHVLTFKRIADGSLVRAGGGPSGGGVSRRIRRGSLPDAEDGSERSLIGSAAPPLYRA